MAAYGPAAVNLLYLNIILGIKRPSPAATVSKMFYVCAMFTNLQAPLISPRATQTGTTSTARVPLTDLTNQSHPISLTPTEVKQRLTVTPETRK